MSAAPHRDAEQFRLAQRARTSAQSEIEGLVYTRSEAVLDALLDNPALREAHLLLLLSRRDLPRRTVAAIGRNTAWMRSYAMKLAMLKHPSAPRHISLPLVKNIYLFDLLGIAMTPGLGADLKRLAEDAILAQMQAIALGQKRTLAHRGTHRLAAGLLLDSDSGVVSAALENPALTDQSIALALTSDKAHPCLVEVLYSHTRWMARRSVQLALARSKHLSLARFSSLLSRFTATELTDLAQDPRLPRNLREYVARMAVSRRRRPRADAGPGIHQQRTLS